MKNVVLSRQITNIAASCPLAQKGGEIKNMKYLAIIAVAVMALGLGACASKTAATTSSTSTTASHGYSK